MRWTGRGRAAGAVGRVLAAAAAQCAAVAAPENAAETADVQCQHHDVVTNRSTDMCRATWSMASLGIDQKKCGFRFVNSDDLKLRMSVIKNGGICPENDHVQQISSF